jgi:hypothetical protein
MKRDFIVAGLLALLGVSCMLKPIQHPIILAFWNPVGFSSLIISLAFLIYLRWDISALVLVALYLYIYNNTTIHSSHETRVDMEKSIDNERFNPYTSVDIGFADGRLTHDSPSILGWTKDASPLLTYPPSQETLRSLNG